MENVIRAVAEFEENVREATVAYQRSLEEAMEDYERGLEHFGGKRRRAEKCSLPWWALPGA